MARAAGFTVVLDGRIGRETYESVSGTLAALRRFGDAYNAPVETDVGQVIAHLRNRAALQIDDADAQLMRDAAALLLERAVTPES